MHVPAQRVRPRDFAIQDSVGKLRLFYFESYRDAEPSFATMELTKTTPSITIFKQSQPAI